MGSLVTPPLTGLMMSSRTKACHGEGGFGMVLTGKPHAKGRPRFSKATGKPFKAESTREFEAMLAAEIKCAWPHHEPQWSCPMILEVVAIFDRPKRLLRKKDTDDMIPHTVVPDASNILKSVEDSLNLSGKISDDSVIYSSRCRKFYGERYDEAGWVQEAQTMIWLRKIGAGPKCPIEGWPTLP